MITYWNILYLSSAFFTIIYIYVSYILCLILPEDGSFKLKYVGVCFPKVMQHTILILSHFFWNRHNNLLH